MRALGRSVAAAVLGAGAAVPGSAYADPSFVAPTAVAVPAVVR